jgi:hypothetical protein
MPTGPKGEKRPADVIGNAVKVMRIATGEEVDTHAADRRERRGKSPKSARETLAAAADWAICPIPSRPSRAAPTETRR